MTRRRVVLICTGILLLTCAGAVKLPLQPSSLDAAIAFQRLRLGMTPNEVELVMGRPPNNPDDHGATSYFVHAEIGIPLTEVHGVPPMAEWTLGNFDVLAFFEGGKLSTARLLEAQPRPTFLNRLSDWLGM